MYLPKLLPSITNLMDLLDFKTKLHVSVFLHVVMILRTFIYINLISVKDQYMAVALN